MAKTAQLTWGLSLRLLKTPFVALDPQFVKCSLSFPSLPTRSLRLVRQPCSQVSATRHPKNKLPSDDIEADFILDSPHLDPQFIQLQYKMTTAGGMRFIVYIVSLALSLAALSTLKLHKLLEWLTMDSDVSRRKSNATRQELQTKSSLISEILQAASQRYSQRNGQECSMTDCNASYCQDKVHLPETSHSVPTSPVKSRFSTEKSEQQDKFQRGCNSESLVSFSHSIAPWIKSPQVNVEFHTQVASAATSWRLSVDLSPPASLLSGIAGLCLASANWISFLSSTAKSPPYSFCRKENFFPRSSILVAHAAALTSNLRSPLPSIMKPSAPVRSYPSNTKPQKQISSDSFHPVIEEFVQELETASFIKEPPAMSIAPFTSTLIPAFNRSTPRALIIRRDFGVDTRTLTRDCACSPIPFSEIVEDSSEIDEHSDADGLELDDEGVYFAYDYHDRVSYNDGTDFDDIDDIELHDVSQKSEDNLTEQEESQQRSEGFSNLVSLIRGISNDLLQLESGCQELIQRVHVNRIELDRVNDNLSYVWNYKDSDDRMEKSYSSACSSNVFSHRYTPMGASFISTTGSCCACNCHTPEKELNRLSSHESDALYLPALSFDDYDYSEMYDNQQYPPHNLSCDSSHQCLLPKSSSFQDGSLS